MELLKKVIDAHQNYNEFLLFSYLKQILSFYIADVSKACKRQPIFFSNFHKVDLASACFLEGRDSLSSLEFSEYESDFEEFSEFMNQRGALVKQPEKDFRIDVTQIKNLATVFCELSARQIKTLLELLEHKKGRIRKLMMVLFCVLLEKSRNKERFINRCALGTCPGLFLLSRLKIISRDPDKSVFLYILLKQIKAFIKNLELKMKLNLIAVKG